MSATPTTITAAETALLARLKAKLPAQLAVEAFPDKPDAYRMTNQKGAVLIAYRGATYEETADVEDVVQRRGMSFDISVLARQLRGHDSAYGIIEMVRCALAGYRVPGFSKCIMRGEKFLGEKSGTWTYVVTVALRTIAMEVDESAVEPLVTSIHLNAL